MSKEQLAGLVEKWSEMELHPRATARGILTSCIIDLEAILATLPEPGVVTEEAHCATCTCVPGMTPAVRFDASPAEREGAVREHLISMGWTPPEEAAPAGEVVAYSAKFRASGDWSRYPIGTRAYAIQGGHWERVENGWKWCTGSTFPTPGGDAIDVAVPVRVSAPPSAPVGVEDLSCCGGNDETPKSHCMDCSRYPGQLAQQPAAVDGDSPYPAPRNRQEAAALAKLALAYLGVTCAHIDAAVARCETDLAAKQGGPQE